MPFSSWLQGRTSIRPPRGQSQRQAAAHGFRPRLESLEDRCLPSTLTVTNNLDGGKGSLRYEIAHASNKSTIVFSPKLDGETITLTSGELDITKNLTIQGPGPGKLTLSGNGSLRVFEVAQSTTVTLSGLTISNGDAVASFSTYSPLGGLGGGILNQGVLTVTDSIVSDNGRGTSAGPDVLSGGGIYNDGTLTVSGCTISGNLAGEGGGIENDRGTLTITASTVSGNHAEFGAGIWTNGTAMVSNSTMSGNQAAPTYDFSGSEEGGGIYNLGTLTLSGCTVTGNYATLQGGAIYNAGTLTVLDSIFSANYPDNIYGSYTDGGGNTFS